MLTEENRQKLDSIVQQMVANQEPDDTIKLVVNDFKQKYGGQGEGADAKPGFIQSTIQTAAKPFLQVASTAAESIESSVGKAWSSRKASEDITNKRLSEGYDYGYLGKVKPVSAESILAAMSGEIGKTEGITRMLAGNAGTVGEIAAYGFSPITAGFTFAGSKAGQALGENKSVMDAGIEGTISGISYLAGYGLLKGAGSLLNNWGARLLQSPAVKTSGDAILGVINGLKTRLSPELQAQFAGGIDNIVNRSGRRMYNIFKKEYDTAFENGKNAIIDASVPTVKEPELAVRTFQNNLGESMGNMFRKSGTLYDNVKTDQFRITEFPNLNKKLTGKQFSGATFELADILKKGGTMNDILKTYDNLLKNSSVLGNEEKSMVRDLAATLNADTKKFLSKNAPELLSEWEKAYNGWQRAIEIYDAPIIQNLKSFGDIDTLRDKFISNSISEPERKVITEALSSEKDTGGAFTNMLFESILRKVKAVPAKEGSKIIDDVLKNWDFALNEKNAQFLEDLGTFLNEDFEQVTSNTFGDVVETMVEKSGKMDIAKLVDKGKLSKIHENIFNLRNTGALKSVLSEMSDGEKRVVGLSIVEKLFQENTPVLSKNLDGTVDATELVNTLKGVLGDINKLGGTENKSSIAKDLFTPEQLTELTKLGDMVSKLDEMSMPIQKSQAIIHGLISILWLYHGSVAGGASHATAAVKSLKNVGNVTKDIMQMIKKNQLDPNWQLRMGDIIMAMSKYVGIGTGNLTQ